MIHDLLLHNGEIRPSDRPCLAPGQVGLLAGWGVFSTLRVAQGVLFEYPRHYARMRRDAKLLHVPFPEDADWLEAELLKLVEANRAQDSTLRVVIVRNRGTIWEGSGVERDFDLVAFTTELNRWEGPVRLGVVPQARHSESRFAGTKVTSWAFNLTMYEEAHERGLDEVVLLNEKEEVSECTSANLFATFGDAIVTPPLSSGCLPGVTRGVILDKISVPGFRIEERILRLEDLERADEVFITSSTRNVLPVTSIEGLTLRTGNRAGEKLRDAFEEYLKKYIAAHLPASIRT